MGQPFLNTQDVERCNEAANLFRQRRYTPAFTLYEQLAQHDYSDCQVFAGWMYYEGIGVAKDDNKALDWFSRAARLGSEKGMFYCGRLLTARGEHQASFQYYEASAALAYAPALYRLGVIYAKGLGIEKNSSLAESYFEKAAAKGHIFAKREIAYRYITGAHGFWKRLKGIGLFASILVNAIRIFKKNKYADELKG